MGKLWLTTFVTLLAIGFVTQYVYPVNYSTLLEFYKSGNAPPKVFYALLLRNVLLVVLWIMMLWRYARHDANGIEGVGKGEAKHTTREPDH